MLRQMRTYYTRYLSASEDEAHIAIWIAFVGGVIFGTHNPSFAIFGLGGALILVLAIYLVVWLAMSLEL